MLKVVLLFSASSSVACNFNDVDVCGYQDLSETGIGWSQLHNQSESFTTCLHNFIFSYC